MTQRRFDLEGQEKRLAVLFDAENISIKYVKVVLDEVSNYGIATYKRAYGDWTNPVLKGWKEEVLKKCIYIQWTLEKLYGQQEHLCNLRVRTRHFTATYRIP